MRRAALVALVATVGCAASDGPHVAVSTLQTSVTATPEPQNASTYVGQGASEMALAAKEIGDLGGPEHLLQDTKGALRIALEEGVVRYAAALATMDEHLSARARSPLERAHEKLDRLKRLVERYGSDDFTKEDLTTETSQATLEASAAGEVLASEARKLTSSAGA